MGGSNNDLEAWENVGACRILAALENKDSGKIEEDDPIGFEYTTNQGYIDVLKVSETSLKRIAKTGNLIPTFSTNESIEDFYAGLVGGYRKDKTSNIYNGINGETIVVMDGDDTLDSTFVSKIAATYSNKIRIVAERCEEIKNTPKNVTILHAPFELINHYE